MKPSIAAWRLERFLLAELPEAEMQEVRAALEKDPALRAALAELERSNAALLAQHPPAVVAAQVRARAAAPRSNARWRFLLFMPALAAAAVLVTYVAPSSGDLAGGPDVTRLKGLAPSLVVHRRQGNDSEVLASGAAARAHDVLQLSYVAAGRRYGVVLSIDGRGGVTLHHPESALDASTLEPSGAVALPHAYELDDAPAFERFFFVTRATPIDVAQVVAAARVLAKDPAKAAAAPLPLDGSHEQFSTLVGKVE